MTDAKTTDVEEMYEITMFYAKDEINGPRVNPVGAFLSSTTVKIASLRDARQMARKLNAITGKMVVVRLWNAHDELMEY